MKKILITGNSGYIGSHLSKMLENDYEVHGLDIRQPQHPVAKFYEQDINRPINIEEEYDAVIHLAALVNVGESEHMPIQYYIFFCLTLFSIGVVGVLTRRNAIIVFMAIELMLNAVNLLLAAFSSYYSDPSGQIFVFFIMAVAAAEVAVGLAIIVMIYRNIQSIDIGILNKLKN